MFFEPSYYDNAFGRSGYPQRQQPRYPPARRNNFVDDEDDEVEDSYYHNSNRVPVRRAAQPQRTMPHRYFQEEDDEEEPTEEVDERLEQFNKKKNYRYSNIPELELDNLSNKGWTAKAHLPRNLYNANLRLQLDGNDTLVVCVVQRGSMFQEPSLVPIAICYLPEEANKDKITATNQGGVLSITIPKMAKPTKKNVKAAKPVNVAKQSKSIPVNQRQQSHKIEVVETPKSKSVPVKKPQAEMSPMTARKLMLQKQEEDVFERALKYAIPD